MLSIGYPYPSHPSNTVILESITATTGYLIGIKIGVPVFDITTHKFRPEGYFSEQQIT